MIGNVRPRDNESAALRRKLKVTIRGMMLLTLVIAAFVAVSVKRLNSRKEAVKKIASLGGSMSFSYSMAESAWLRRFINDDDYFREISSFGLGPSNSGADAMRPAGDAELCDAISSLPDPSKLRSIRLYNSLVSDDGLSCLQVLSNLERLELRSTLVTDAGLQRIACCNQLRSLDLAGTTISDRGLPSLVPLQRLESLDLGDTSITEYGLRPLARIKTLRRLDLAGTQFIGGGFLFLKELPNLETLILDDTEFGSGGSAAHILPRYADVFPNLRELSLKDVPISDSDLQYLHQFFPFIEKLILDGTAVTDDGLLHIKNMTNLTELSLKKTKVTSQGVTAMQRMLRSCRISAD